MREQGSQLQRRDGRRDENSQTFCALRSSRRCGRLLAEGPCPRTRPPHLAKELGHGRTCHSLVSPKEHVVTCPTDPIVYFPPCGHSYLRHRKPNRETEGRSSCDRFRVLRHVLQDLRGDEIGGYAFGLGFEIRDETMAQGGHGHGLDVVKTDVEPALGERAHPGPVQ